MLWLNSTKIKCQIFFTRCICGHTVDDHWHGVGESSNCDKCQCSAYKFSAILQNSEKKIADTEERLREVLRNKYQEFCPECHKHFGLVDFVYDTTKFSFSCQIICQNCYKILVDITTIHYIKTLKGVSNYRYNINYVIETLNKFPEFNTAK